MRVSEKFHRRESKYRTCNATADVVSLRDDTAMPRLQHTVRVRIYDKSDPSTRQFLTMTPAEALHLAEELIHAARVAL